MADALPPAAARLAPWASQPASARHEPWSPDASLRYCLGVARAHAENFPVVFAGMGRERQEALAAVYAFARQADDFADEPAYEGMRADLLDAWESQLERCFRGDATHPVFVALSVAAWRHGLDPQPFRDLLDAFRQDGRTHRYGTFDEVLDYCRRSANPVGRLVLDVLDLREPWAREASDRICTALQLTNFWQDLSVDLPRDRLYVPLADCREAGVDPADLLARREVPGVAALLGRQFERTAALFDAGRPLLRAPLPGGLYFGAVWAGGRAVLALCGARGASLLKRRPALGARAVPSLAAAAIRAAARRGFGAWTA